MKKIKARVFVVDNEKTESYGELIIVSKFVEDYEKIICRVAGASMLCKDKEVGVELFDENRKKKKVIIGEGKIEEELWRIMIRWLR